MRSRLRTSLAVGAAALIVLSAAGVYAQLEGSERGIPPVDSTTNFEIGGVEVDVTAANAEAARLEGWRQAQSLGWKMLWARTNNRPMAQAPNLPESTLNGMVSGIVVENEQIGPRRYIARLGVLFDRARTGGLLGVQGLERRSQPMLVVPVMITAGSPYSFEFRNEWQRAWAQFRTAASPVDYVRTSGSGADPLLLNAAQTRRRNRGWWRMLLDQYGGAADVLIPEVQLRRLFPGGPAEAVFTARFGPDGRVLGRFGLRVQNGAAIPRMMDEGVRRMDAIYVRALEAGLLQPDPSLVIVRPELPPELLAQIEQIEAGATPRVPEASTAPDTPAPAATGIAALAISVPTPDAEAIQRAEIAVARVSGVLSALTVTPSVGGTSVMRVTYSGDPAALAEALRGQGWTVEQTGSGLRISR